MRDVEKQASSCLPLFHSRTSFHCTSTVRASVLKQKDVLSAYCADRAAARGRCVPGLGDGRRARLGRLPALQRRGAPPKSLELRGCCRSCPLIVF